MNNIDNKPLATFSVNLPDEVIVNLRKLAAKQNLENPNKVTSAGGIARKILIDNITKLMEVSNHE